MVKTCPACGAEAPDPFRFCGLCGASLQAAPSVAPSVQPTTDERSSRRLVTILFADLCNYTRTSSMVDPEEIYLTTRNSLERLAQSVHRHGGRIDRYVGDGILATFGVPEAHENDPARALQAALEMQEAMQDLRRDASQSLGWDVQLRIGVNIGPVISGPIDTGSLLDSSVFGYAVNLASRLQEAARPGTILVSEAIYRRAHAQFDFLEPVKLTLKGIDRPAIGYELVDLRPDPQPSRGLSGRRTPLVGRSTELEALIAGLQRLRVERNGTIALVTGEAGWGKTRLVDEVLAPLSGSFTIVRGECSPNEAPSYALLADVIENLAGILPNDTIAVRERRIDDLLSLSGTLASEISPVLRELVGAPTPEKKTIGDPQQQQRRIYAAARRLFARLARRQALLLVLDDLQWADPSSLDVLAHVAELVHEAPIALIAIARSSARGSLPGVFVDPCPAHPDSFQDIRLQPLSAEESDHLVTLLLRDVALPLGLRRNIVTRSDGNPLLIEELVRMLLDQNVIRKTSDGWQIAEHWAEAVQKVPDSVNGLILGRYDHLEPALKQVLDAASVLGRSFSLPGLAAMTETQEPGVRRELDRLEQADFVRRSSRAGVPVYFFRHALMQEAIYQTILQTERSNLHLRAAQAIQQMAEDLALDSAAFIGHHLERAQSPKAIAHLMRAATQAADRYANQEATDYYQRVQALLDRDATRQSQAVDVALGLAELLARTNQLDAALEQLGQAQIRSLAPPTPGYRSGDILYQLGCVNAMQGTDVEAIAAFETASQVLQETPEQCSSFTLSDTEREIGWVMCRQGKLSDARVSAEKALDLAQHGSDVRAIASAHNLLTPIHYWSGRPGDAVANASEALAIREQIGDVWGAARAQTNLAHLYHRLGEWAQAESYLRQAIFVQQEIGDHQGAVLSSNNLGLLLCESGRFDEALDYQNQAIAALHEQRHPPTVASELYANRGLVWLRLGDVSRASSDFEQCLRSAKLAKNDDHSALALAYLAEARLAADEIPQAEALLDQAAELARASGSPEVRAEILRVESGIQKAKQEWSGALQANQQARELYRQVGNTHEEARIKINDAEIRLAWHEQDERVALDADLERSVLEALTLFRKLDARADIPHAEALYNRITSALAPSIARTDAGRQQVVIVNLRLRSPDPSEESWEQQERIAAASNRMMCALKEVGRSYGAVVATGASGLTYLLSDPGPDSALRLALTSIKSARTAVDAGVRLNRTSKRQYGFQIPLSVGIVAGCWQQPLQDPREASIFASISQIGRQAEAAATLAPANQILLSGEIVDYAQTAHELEHFETLEGLSLSGPVYCLGRARSETKLLQPLPGSSLHLIGRDAEFAALSSWVDRIRTEPRGQVCYLEAKAGMGKTRLLQDVVPRADADLVCLWGKCEPFRSNISYWPLIDMLGRGDLPDTLAGRRVKSLLSLQPPDDTADYLLRNLSPANLRQEFLGCVRELLLDQASRHPLLIVVEDIHWLDLSSLDLLDYLLPLTLQAPVSILLVARAEMPGPHRALVGKAERICQDRYLRISLSSLTPNESYALIQDLLDASILPASLWHLLEPLSGHPLSLEEALRFLIERSWLWRANGSWQLGELERSLEHNVPTTLRDLLLGRLDILDSETLHLLQAAAVLGESFDRTILSHIVPGSALSGRLAELIERGWLLAGNPDNPLPYRFKHTLKREMIYATLLTSKRQVLHQRAGEAIEALYPELEEEYVELLAHHFGRSGLREKSLHYLVRAAEKSAARYALAEGLGYYQQAVEVLTHNTNLHPGINSKIALGMADIHLALGDPARAISDVMPLLEDSQFELAADLRAACLRRLGSARRRMGEFSLSLEHFQTALSTLAAWKRSHAQIPGAPPESVEGELQTIELGIAQTLFDIRDNQHAKETAERVLSSIDRRLHPKLAAEALRLLGGIAHRQGDPETAAQQVQQSLSIYQLYGNRPGAASAYANLGILASSRQDTAAAHDNFSLSLEMHEALGNMLGISISHNNLGQLERNRGKFAKAVEHLSIAAETARRSELTQVLAQSLVNLGHVLTLAGRTKEALVALDEAESLCRSYGFRDIQCEGLWKRADCLIESEDLATAETVALSAVSLAVELDSQDLKSEAQRALGRAYRAMGNPEKALEQSGSAWQNRADSPDPVTRARFAADYSLALIACGRTKEAHDLLLEFVAPVQLYETGMIGEEISKAITSTAARRT